MSRDNKHLGIKNLPIRCQRWAPSRIFLQEQGDKVCAALGYDAETLKFIAKHRLITKEVALRAAVQCSARGFVEATALLMELAQGLNVTNDPTFCQQIC